MEPQAVRKFHDHDLRLQRLEDSNEVLNDKFIQHMEWEEKAREEDKLAREKLADKVNSLDEKIDTLTLSNFSTSEGQRSFKAQVVVAVTVAVGLISVIQSIVVIYMKFPH